jgi:RHS repeat-associated protein
LWGKTEVSFAKKTDNYQPVVDCSLRFQNQWEDKETGLYYNLNRYYDPDSGQYLSTDPIGLEGGIRTHGYVHDPMQWVDPLGLAGCPVWDAKAGRWRDSTTGRFMKSPSGLTTPKVGQKIYRIFGEKNNPYGESWTPIDPRTSPNYRSEAGLPDVNTGRFALEGKINNTSGITVRKALPLDGNPGGLTEYLIPDAKSQVSIERASGVNPEF